MQDGFIPRPHRPYLVELFAVNVGHGFALHTRIEIKSQDALDLRLFKPMHLKAFAGDFALNAVGGFKPAFPFDFSGVPQRKKLPRRRHFRLNVVEEIDVLF